MQQRVCYRKKRQEEILHDAFANGSENFSRFAGRLLNQYHKLFSFHTDTLSLRIYLGLSIFL